MAVKVSITLPGTLDQTTTVGTAELVRTTGWVVTLWRFIGSIAAVFIMITHEVFRNTLSVLTHKLLIVTRVVEHTASLAALIESIRTVIVSITLPALGHTHMGAGTLEGLGTTRLITTFSFVRVVSTVVGSVTHPVVGDTAMVTALELVGLTELITGDLVSSVLAVVLVITGPAERNAAATRTRKEQRWTLGGLTTTTWAVSLI